MPSTDRELQILADVARSNRIIADAAARAYERRHSPSARRSRSPAASRRSLSPSYPSQRSRRTPSPRPRYSSSRRTSQRSPPPPARPTEHPPHGRGGIKPGFRSRGSQPRYRAERATKQKDIGDDLRRAGRSSIENFIKNAGKKTDKASQPEQTESLQANQEPPGSEFDIELYGEEPCQ